jgi:predicted porin
VLLNYVIGPQPESTLNTFQFSIGLRYDITRGFLQGFSPYARFGLVEQDVSGGGGLIIADSIRDYIVGADYHIYDITLTAEYEDYQSKIIPFNAVRLSARYDHNFSSDTQVTLSTSYTLLDYTMQGERTENYLASVSFTHRLTRDLFLTGSANWIMVDDSIGGSTEGAQELLEVRWRRRQLELYARVRNSNLRGDQTSSDFQFVQVGLSRKF